MIQAPNLMIPKVSPVQQYATAPIKAVPPVQTQAQPQVVTTEQNLTAPIYNIPTASVYDMPKQSVFAPKTEEKVAEKKVDEIKTEPKPEVKKPEIKKPDVVAPERMNTGIDLNGLISILTSSDYEEQADAMEAISEVTMFAPERATELIDAKVIDVLLGIMNKDTNEMTGLDKAKADRNKQFAMYTTATLQKLYADEIKKVASTTVPMDELIGMAGIVSELKTNPNAKVREAAVASLGYIKRPDYKNDLGQLFSEATTDTDDGVKTIAEKELGKLLNTVA